jgi:peptidoglycan/LPS O-acetylase OafA/YrhL
MCVGKSALPHRNDIDGLRAVAIIQVVLFHTGIPSFSGAYIGVDVFFVISGYLLTGIILREIARDSFSLGTFYERRIRRIVPALIAMLLTCSIACYFLLLPQDLVRFGHSLFSALLSGSNFYFWTQAGYFKPDHAKVLLHTWSLGVEEQFYLFLPLTLLALRRRRALLIWGLIGLTVMSLGVAEWLVLHREAETAFYMPFSRAWELLVGSLIAMDLVSLPKAKIWRELLAATGALSIGFAACWFSPKTPFPGASALLPCVGAALLLMVGANGGSICTGLLSLPPLVFVGTISYSVYLWHWPLVTFAKMGGIQGVTDKGPLQKLVVLLASLLLGWLSWRLVEQPFRERRAVTISSRQLYTTLTAASVVVLAVAAVCTMTRGLPGRFPPTAMRIGNYLDAAQEMRIGSCFITSGNHFSDFKPDTCTKLDPSGHNYLLVGDSHAAALWFGLYHALKQSHILQVTSSGCSPLLGQYDSSDCGDMRRYVYEALLPRTHVDGVILTEHWQSVTDIERLEPTIKWLQMNKISVYLVGPVQEYDAPLPMLMAFAIKRREPMLPERHLLSGVDQLDRFLHAKAAEWQVVYLSPWQQFCGTGRCQEFSDAEGEIPVLTDTNHLTNAASVRLAKDWVTRGVLQ